MVKSKGLAHKGRLIALDFGEKRSGIAVTDPMQMIASPYKGVETRFLLDELFSLIEDDACAGLVVGLPLRMHGGLNEVENRIQNILKTIVKRYPQMPIYRVDERLTSKMAVQSLINSGVPKNKRRDKLLIDSTSAAIILQSFLENLSK